MNRHLFSLALSVLSLSAYAQNNAAPCDVNDKECLDQAFKNIYPFRPMPTSDVKAKLVRLSENENFLWDIREMTKRGLTKANTKNQPWGGSFWPLIQGQVANPYHDKDFRVLHGAFNGLEVVSWKYNYKKFEKRQEKLYPKIYELSEKELAELAPSEKYDLLLGDTSFDLTKRIWNYASTWGEKKEMGFFKFN